VSLVAKGTDVAALEAAIVEATDLIKSRGIEAVQGEPQSGGA